MGFLKKLFSGKNKGTQTAEAQDEVIERRSLELKDPEQRKKYITGCLEQMQMASNETDLLNGEYNQVTAYLKDMEEIERLPENYAQQITDYANKLINLEKERAGYNGRKNRISEEQFRAMERICDEMPQGYEKIQKAEEYRKKVKSDLNRVEGEKQAFFYQERELLTQHANYRGLSLICLIAMGLCIVMLLILFLTLELDIRLGAIVTIAAGVIVLTILFVKNQDAMRELIRVRQAIAKLITMQNTVKIRYVNNTNLLDYLYMKYAVNSAEELKVAWEGFLQEKIERERMEQTGYDLKYYRDELLRVLRKLHIAYPEIWLRQVPALTDSKEMVEIRHGLIQRRQQLRKQMDFNSQMAIEAQNEIKDIAQMYPSDSVTILKMLSEYEQKK